MTAWSHIEVSGGRVTRASHKACNFVRDVIEHVGQFRFFVEVVDFEGGRLGLDSFSDYEAALRRAEQAREDFSIDHPVRDNIAGRH